VIRTREQLQHGFENCAGPRVIRETLKIQRRFQKIEGEPEQAVRKILARELRNLAWKDGCR